MPLTALTMRMPRHRLIAGTVAVFAVSQFAAALAPNFEVLALSRLLCALVHGVFWSIVAPVAARLAPPGQAGRATALVFLGNSLALVLGLPLGTVVGQAFGWRIAIAAFAVAGAVSLAGLLAVLPHLPALPHDLAAGTAQRLRTAVAAVRNRAVAVICAITLVLVIGHFSAYTYIAPLVRRGGLEGGELSALLLGYGAAGAVGVVLAGQVVDRRPRVAVVAMVGACALALAALALPPATAPTVIAVLVWGAGFTAVPICLQAAVLRVAPRAADAGSAAYVVAFQIGIGGGALVGERLFQAGHLDVLPALGAVLAAASAAIVLAARRTFPAHLEPGQPTQAAPVDRLEPAG